MGSSGGSTSSAPLVSVVIAAFNAASYIAHTCASVLQQTYSAFELIVVDDGSTDATADIIRDLAASDARVRLVTQENQGVAAARNRGIAEAKGEFVAPLDADDLWDPTKLEQQVQRMREAGPDTGMVYSWWAWIDLSNIVIDRSPRWLVEGRVLDQLVEVNFTGNASVPLYRRSCLEHVGGYNTAMRLAGKGGCEDWDLAIRVAERYAVAVVPAVLVGYRRRNDSMSTECERMWQSHLELLASMAARKSNILPDVLERSSGQFALYLAGVCFWSGRYLQAIRWSARARPLSLMFAVIPYAAIVVVKRLIRKQPRRTAFGSANGRFDETSVKEPLIPYATLYDRHWHPGATHGVLSLRRAQIAGIALAILASGACHWRNDGLWFQGDAPRHAATGLFVLDYLSSLSAHPLDFALSYYARYPIIVPLAYPPLFYLLEAAAFSVFAPTPQVPKILVLAFAALTGLYTMIWARRRMAPIAGWAGTTAVALPAFVFYSNSVLLNVPAVALCLGSLYHLQEWLDSGEVRQRRYFVLVTLAAVLTYFPAAIVLPIAVVWSILSKRVGVTGSRILWLTVTVLLVVTAFAWYTVPTFSTRNAPSIGRLVLPAAWKYYAAALLHLVGAGWLVLTTTALVYAAATERWRVDAVRLASAFPIVIVGLVLLPAYSERYALLLVPLTVLSVFLGLTAIAQRLGRWCRPATAVGTVALVSVAIWSGARVRIPEVTGFREVATYLRDHAPSDSLLYSGRYDGLLGFYIRASDPRFERRLVLTKSLLYRAELDARFVRVETPRVGSPAEAIALIRRQCGCRWIAIEIGDEEEMAVSDRYLREALAGSEFERVQSFPISGASTSRIDLYRFVDPVEQAPPMDLEFPTFSTRVFRGVGPISTRPAAR